MRKALMVICLVLWLQGAVAGVALADGIIPGPSDSSQAVRGK